MINTTITGSAIITKVIAGSGINLSSTGFDAGTGDVTINTKLQRKTVSDTNYTILNTDQLVAYTSLSSARTITLPTAASYPTSSLLIIDESGNCNGSNTITINPNSSSDYINGSGSVIINMPYGFIQLESNGANNWTIVTTNTYYRYSAVRQEFFPTAGTTSIPVSGGYNVGFVDVYLNGIKLTNNDFTATNGTTVVLNTATSSGDDVQIISLASYSVGYALAGSGDAITGTSSVLLMTPSTTNTLLANTPKLGSLGNSGTPVIHQGASIDASGVRYALTTSGYTIPNNTSLVRFTQTSTIASATITMPTASGDGHVIQINNYAGQVTTLTFSPAIVGWANGNQLNATSSIRVRWDSIAATWYREE